jgi:hypothetical protein
MTAPVMTPQGFTTDSGLMAPPAATIPTAVQNDERSLRELVAKLADDGSRLLRQESELAKRELKDKADDVQEKVVQAAIGGAVVYAGVLAVMTAVILLLGLAIPYWLSALVVGIAVGAGGMMMLKSAKTKDVELKPERTVSNVRRDAYVMKEAAR